MVFKGIFEFNSDYGQKLDEIERKELEAERRLEDDLDYWENELVNGEDPDTVFKYLHKDHPEMTWQDFVLEMHYRNVDILEEQTWQS